MKEIHLTLISKGHETAESVKSLAQSIIKRIKNIRLISIETYPKFEYAYRINLAATPNTTQSINEEAIFISSKICSPWLVYIFEDEGDIELIFNADKNARFATPDFEQIFWGHLQIIKATVNEKESV